MGGRERERGEVEGRVEMNREKENYNCLRTLGDGIVNVGIGSCLSILGFFPVDGFKYPCIMYTCRERERERGRGRGREGGRERERREGRRAVETER